MSETVIDRSSDDHFMAEALRQARRAYAAGEVPIPGLTGHSIVDSILAHGQREASFVPKVDDLPGVLAELTQPGDLVMTLGAGNITTVGPAFLALP